MCVDNYGGDSSDSIDGYVDVNKCLSAEEQYRGKDADILGKRHGLRHWVNYIQLGH